MIALSKSGIDNIVRFKQKIWLLGKSHSAVFFRFSVNAPLSKILHITRYLYLAGHVKTVMTHAKAN